MQAETPPNGDYAKTQTAVPSWPAYLRTALKLITGAGLIVVIFFRCYSFWEKEFNEALGPSINKLGTVYTYGKNVKPFPARTLNPDKAFLTCLYWIPLGAGTLLMIVAQRLPNEGKPSWLWRTQLWGRRIMRYQLPPVRFWIYWCGGLSVMDALFLGTVLAMNVMWFCTTMATFNNQMRALADTGIITPIPVSQLRLKEAAFQMGRSLMIDVWILLLPIPQSSFLQELIGLNYHQMIRWHRWMGRVVLTVASAHGILYYIYWGITHQFATEFTDWGEKHFINNLAGSISWFFGLGLWATSIEWVRRQFFETFYRCHIIFFLGFTLFAYFHYWGFWSWFAPGLLLWFIDLVLRAGSLTNTTAAHSGRVREEQDVVTLEIPVSQRGASCPIHDIYLLLPDISRWQWHPFTVAYRSIQGLITLNIKPSGEWTKALRHHLSHRLPLAIRASAPPYSAPRQWRHDDIVVVVAGGIASTAVLGVLSDLVTRHRNGLKGPSKVYFIWVARHAAEFCTMDVALAEAAIAPGGWLNMSLHYTGAELLEEPSMTPKTPSLESLSEYKLESSPGAPSVNSGPVRFRRVSPFFWNIARKLQPQVTGPIHHSIVVGLVFFGGFVGRQLAYNYTGEFQSHYNSTAGAGIAHFPNFCWRQGGIDFMCFFIVGLGLPYLFAIFLPGLYRYWKDTSKDSTSDEVLTLVDDPSNHGHTDCTLAGPNLAIPGSESSIPIATGRPDLAQAFQAVAKEMKAQHIGVYVAGPDLLAKSAQLTICKLNRIHGGPFFDFHKMAGFL